MYLVTEMNWSDVAMGDGNPQTRVCLRETLEEAQAAVILLCNEDYASGEDDDQPIIFTFEEAVEFLKSAPGSPEIDISEIKAGGDFQYLTREVLDDHPRTFNGKREIE
jgi:hypothetical protein